MEMDLRGSEGDIPITISSTYVAHPHHHPEEEEEEEEEERSKKQLVLMGGRNGSSKGGGGVRYRECLKNHAASMGGTATDGCGEFMASGEEGSIEALKCSACSCHRNFHRKEIEGEPAAAALFHHQLREFYHYNSHHKPPGPAAALVMPLGAIHSTAAAESDDHHHEVEMMMMMRGPPHSHPPPHPNYGHNYNTAGNSAGAKKRFRTKFTQEQKEKMLGFAERVGWRLPRQEDGSVQHLCQEIGIKRRVLKVWMHNNKHTLSNKSISTTPTNHSTNSSSSLPFHP